MRSPTDTPWANWLAAEHSGRDAEAERALTGMFSALPEVVPRAGFADRVLIGAGLLRPSVLDSRWSRAAIAGSLLTVALALVWTLPAILGLTRLVAPGELAGLLVQGFVAAVSRVDELVTLWQIWTRIASTAMLVATSPPVVLTVLGLCVLSALTFRGLSELLSLERNPDYV